MRVFPLDSLNWLYGALIARLQQACKDERSRWKGFRLLAADKTTLALPESLPLWKKFGAHNGQQGLGSIGVELCCLFDVLSRAPLRFVFGKSSTSEHKLILKLIQYLKKGDLILMDSGFYCCSTFRKILQRHAHFLIPSKTKTRPQVIETFSNGDYLCQIRDYDDETFQVVRVVFVYRKGFRRRRLVTSLIDPLLYPASELAKLYHMRWDIETFYRDFKHSLRATSWHCHTPKSFHQELLVHMIVFCLVRIAMLEASRLANLPISKLSFARALTETRLFLKLLLSKNNADLWPSLWSEYVRMCSSYQVRSKPDRSFPRDRQEYRRKSRGLEKSKKGRKRKYETPTPLPQQPETLKNSKDTLFLLD